MQGTGADGIVEGDAGMHSGGGGRALPSDALEEGVIVNDSDAGQAALKSQFIRHMLWEAACDSF